MNSTTYDFKSGRFVRRLCFGFLGTDSWKEPEGSLVGSLFDLVRHLRFSTAAWLLNTYQVQCIFSRTRPPLSIIPRRWWQFLVKKRWFRNVFSLPEEIVEETGSERKLPLVLGPPLAESSDMLEAKIKKMARKVTRWAVNEWRGHLCAPVRKQVRKRPPPKRNACLNVRLSRGVPQWKRLWCEPVLELLKKTCPHVFEWGSPTWVIDQPDLTTVVPLKRSVMRPCAYPFGPPTSLLHDALPIVNDLGERVLIVQGTSAEERDCVSVG